MIAAYPENAPTMVPEGSGNVRMGWLRAAIALAAAAGRSSRGSAVVDVSDADFVLSIAHPDETEILRMPRAAAAGDTATLRDAIRSKGIRATEVTLRLPYASALRRTISLPSAATSKLPGILKYELDRHSPLDSSETYFDYWIKNHDQAGTRLEVELRIVQRAALDDAIRLCRFLKLEPVALAFRDDAVAFNRSSLRLNRTAMLRALWRRWRVPFLSILALVLGVAVLTASLLRYQLAAQDLTDRIRDAGIRVKAIEGLRSDISAAHHRAAFLSQEKNKPLLVQILAETTKRLPDGTWLSEFQVTGNDVRVRGFSSSAAALIALFDASPLFANVQFRAPTIQSQQDGLERFDMSFSLEERTP